MQVRRARLADMDALAPLFSAYRTFYGQEADQDFDRAFLQKRLEQQQSVVFLACHSGNGIGFTQLYPTFSSVALKRDWILNDLYVMPAARGVGAGASLLEAARDFGRSDGARHLVLETQADNPARFLYEKMGWQLDEHRHYWIAC